MYIVVLRTQICEFLVKIYSKKKKEGEHSRFSESTINIIRERLELILMAKI